MKPIVLSGDPDPLSDKARLANAAQLGVDAIAARTWLAAHRNGSKGDER